MHPQPLELAIDTLDELEREVDTTIRQEFRDYGDRLDEVITLIRAVDRTDVVKLVSQMGYMQSALEVGAQCACEPEARWHACLGRLSVAIAAAAHRYNVRTTKLFCEWMGLSFEEIVETLELINELTADDETEIELPDVQIPDDVSELTK